MGRQCGRRQDTPETPVSLSVNREAWTRPLWKPAES